MSERTPAPSEWKIDGDAIVWIDRDKLLIRSIAFLDNQEGLARERAEFIVRCVHAHDDLLNACKAVLNMRIVCPEDAEREVEMCRAAVEKANVPLPSEGSETSQDVGFEKLLGPHLLSGVEMANEKVKLEWDESYEDCQTISFIIDGQTYTAIENPDDGYRSSMGYLRRSDVILANTFSPQPVIGRMRLPEYGQVNDTLEFLDANNRKLVLAVGTDNIDDYYPCFVAEWIPENMTVNQNVEGLRE